MNGSAWSGKRSDNLRTNVGGPFVGKTTTAAWAQYAGQASSSKMPIMKQQPVPKSSMDEYAGEAASLLDTPLPHLSINPAAASQSLKPTPPMNAGRVSKSAKQDSKVPCTYKDCSRGFTKEADMKRHKDEDHDWCRLCDVDCADDEAFLEHKVQSEMHICCDICGEDFRSERGKERHMRQVSS